MEKKDMILVGSGQCGGRLANTFMERFSVPKKNVVCFNTAEDNKFDNQILLKSEHNEEAGSGRNPLYTLETILPRHKDKLRQELEKKIEEYGARTFILFSSMGGGSGSAINYYILNEILIPLKEIHHLNLFLVPVFGFKHEGNPINSNGVAILNLYTSIYKDVTILPIQNDVVFEDGKVDTFDVTNNKICDNLRKVLDFDFFLGTPKSNGLGTLDKNEFRRITAPQGGFLSYTECSPDDFTFEDNPLNNFDIKTATSIIVMFRTKPKTTVDIKHLKKLEELFPNALRILCESVSEDNKSKVEIIVNGLEMPEKEFLQIAETTYKKIGNLKEERKEIKGKNKKTSKLGKKNLFNI